jgi:hypothetical protein
MRLPRRLLTYSLRYDDRDLGVFCLAKPGGAEAFAERFGGSGWRTGPAGGDPENNRATCRDRSKTLRFRRLCLATAYHRNCSARALMTSEDLRVCLDQSRDAQF